MSRDLELAYVCWGNRPLQTAFNDNKELRVLDLDDSTAWQHGLGPIGKGLFSSLYESDVGAIQREMNS